MAPKPAPDADLAEMRNAASQAEALTRLRQRIDKLPPEQRSRLGHGPPPVTSLWYTPQVILSIVGLLAGGAAGTAVFIANQAARISNLEHGVEEGRLRANIWVPRIERSEALIVGLTAANQVQDSRMENVIDAIRENRKGSSEVSAKLSSISEDLAAIKARMGLDRRTENKTLPVPDR